MRIIKEKPSGTMLSPGERLVGVLKDRDMSQVDLAAMMGRSPQYVQDIIKRRKAMDARLAVELEESLGTPTASEWLLWELDFQKQALEVELSSRVNDGLKRRDVMEEFPFALDAVKFGWIEDDRDPNQLRQNILNHLALAETKKYATNFRTSGALATVKDSLKAWTIRCFIEAEELDNLKPLPPYKRSHISTRLVPDLQEVMATEDGVQKVPGILERHGIRFLVTPSLRKAPVDGLACENHGKPFISLSLRHGQIDRFWFVLMHELAHLHYGHKDSDVEYNSFDIRNTATPQEKQADELASCWLIPNDEFGNFVNRNLSLENVRAFAEKIKRHPAIVLGRLKREGYLTWTVHAREHVSVRDDLAKVMKVNN